MIVCCVELICFSARLPFGPDVTEFHLVSLFNIQNRHNFRHNFSCDSEYRSPQRIWSVLEILGSLPGPHLLSVLILSLNPFASRNLILQESFIGVYTF